MKKAVSITCAAMLMFSMLTGCGGSAPSSSSAATSETSGEPVTINYYGRPDDNGVESAIVANFEKENPDIKVNYVELPDSSNDRLKTISTVLQVGDSSIDVFAADVVWPPIFVSAGWVIPLDSYVTQEDLDQYLAGPLSAFQMQGHTYGLPFMADTGALYYRSDLLEKYNLPIPQTWEELMTTAQTILEGENNPDLRGFSSYWKQAETLTSCALEVYWAKGGDVVDENGASVVDEAKMTEALTLMREMMDTPSMTVDGIETFGTTESRNVVTAGDAIFTRDWLSGYAPFNAEGSEVAGVMDITSVPGGSGTLGGWGVMVSAYSKNPDAAVKFAQYRANYESQVLANEMTSIVPTLKAIYEDPAVLETTPHLPEFLPVLEKSRPRPLSPYYAEISGIMQLEVHSVVSGLSEPADAAANIKNQVDTLLN